MKATKRVLFAILCLCGLLSGCATAHRVSPEASGAVPQAGPKVKYAVKVHEFEGCECMPTCPCVFSTDSPMGGCRGIIAFTLEDGVYGSTRLKDLTLVAVFTYSGKNMDADMGKWKGVLYTPENASEAELDAITGLFPLLMGNAFGTLEKRTAPIVVKRDGDVHDLTVGTVARLKFHGLKGPNGKPSKIVNASSPMAYPEYFCAVSDVHTYDDGTSSWSFPGRNCFYADINLSNP